MRFEKLVTALCAALLTASAAVAQDISERTIKVGIGLTEDHPQAQSVEKFGELVEEKSGGKIKVKMFAGGTLGNDVTMISALQGGTLEMTVPDTSTLVNIGGLEPFGLINLPFLLESGEQADGLLDGPFGQKLLAKLPDKGLVGLGFWENGFRQVTNNRRADRDRRRLYRPEAAGDPEPAVHRDFLGPGGLCSADALPRGLHGARDRRGRRPGEPARDDPRLQIHEVQELRGDVEPHLQRLGAADGQEVLGQAVPGRAED